MGIAHCLVTQGFGDAKGSWSEFRSPGEGDQREGVLWEGVGQCSWVLSRKV